MMKPLFECRSRFLRIALLSGAALCASFISAASARAQAAPTVTGAAVGVSSAAWTWPLSAGATGYRVLLTTGPGTGIPVGTNVSGDLSTAAVNSFTLNGLSTNTIAGVLVEAFGPGFTVDAPTSTVLTLAASPSGTMLLGTINNQVSLSWLTNGNPATGMSYNINWTTSTGAGILFSTNPAVSVFTGSAAATINNLPGGQTINFDVQAVNSSGVASGFDVIVTTTIPVLSNQSIISSASFANGVSSITWYWSASTGAIAYQLFSATNGAVSPLLSSATLTYTQTGLSTNTAYTDYVFAFSVPTSTASAPFIVATLAAPTTGLTLLGLSGPSVSTPTVSELLSWGANGNPVSTQYNVLWWTNLTSTVTVAPSTGTTSALIGGLYGGSTVYFTVQAVNLSGSTAAFDSTLFGVVPSTSFAASAQVLPVGFSGAVTFVVPNSGGTGSGVVTVMVASGTFSSAVTLAVSTPDANPPFPTVGGSVADLPSPIHLTISAKDAFGAAQQPNRQVILSVNYAAANFAANQTTLDICRFDAIRGVWIPLATAKNGTALMAATDHLSSFAVLGVAAASSLSSITVGPNPLRPIVNPGAVMTFRNLPAGCRVRIFSYVGEKIVDMIADGSGIVAWNGRNHVGSFVASGVYIALIEGAGTNKTMRVAIER
ncbi:MAG: hypothetical protein ACHQ2Z_10280 [Elusimicrobiota bacterium]